MALLVHVALRDQATSQHLNQQWLSLHMSMCCQVNGITHSIGMFSVTIHSPVTEQRTHRNEYTMRWIIVWLNHCFVSISTQNSMKTILKVHFIFIYLPNKRINIDESLASRITGIRRCCEIVVSCDLNLVKAGINLDSLPRYPCISFDNVTNYIALLFIR